MTKIEKRKKRQKFKTKQARRIKQIAVENRNKPIVLSINSKTLRLFEALTSNKPEEGYLISIRDYIKSTIDSPTSDLVVLTATLFTLFIWWREKGDAPIEKEYFEELLLAIVEDDMFLDTYYGVL